MSQTIASVLDAQSALLEAASEALPHQFSQCTYPLGPIRQAVYLCLTCKEPRGICSACSIACHSEHEQLELFPKRHFRCDCPTQALLHPCTLHKALEERNTENLYGQNFQGVFCRCGRPYDAYKERETMIQCLACEDWFHESCLNLRERPLSREPSPQVAENEAREGDDAVSEASTSGLPPPLVSADDYDSLVCSACVREIPILRRYAGTPGVLMVIRDNPEGPWKVIGRQDSQDETVNIQERESEVGEKRTHSADPASVPEAKRARVSPEPETKGAASSPCLAPPPNPVAQDIISRLLSESDTAASDDSLGKGDIFLTEGFRERWCKCPACLPSLENHSYLLAEEETYEPPEDPDSKLTLEELGLRALQRLPRDRAIEGIRAFNTMRDELMNHLRPFAEEDREVTEEDIRAFFERRLQANPAE
ncbi:uncharacterized protein LAESUDRAFT_762511 [Laetiporus sulphureus 93-53]|uniref:UBR-type domain-containing protein n=1 Tax=Laetiporus sulphureus 93-53 TaxID=1314785 RepID=A0A165CIA6_9APHY|nr:uncharacterized protein LAESUDRAFT_762511 [Laetiporus sulphureus 93-53]KZT02862.1 hypothetical protein LAESUDRAFT_762511 [Laetiporus sulphureus 93-53]